MGNGNNIRNLSPEIVALKLMNKEYPNMFGHASPTFIPEVFIPSQPYVYNELEKEQIDILNNVATSTEPHTSNTSIAQKLAKNYDRKGKELKYGHLVENFIYQQLNEIFSKNSNEDVVVLHGTHVGIAKQKLTPNLKKLEIAEKEFDFLIFLPQRKLIIPLEVKTTMSIKSHSKASVQLQNSVMFLENNFFDILDEDWQFCPTVYFLRRTKNICLEHCKKWTIFGDDDLAVWLDRIMKTFPIVVCKIQQNKAKTQVIRVVGLLLFVVHMKQPMTTSKIVSKISDLMEYQGMVENILFWNKGQLQLIEDPDKRFVCFDSGPGTGKSTLLQQKAEREANNGKYCLYIIGGQVPSDKPSLVHRELEKRWRNQPRIRLMSYKDIQVLYI